MRQLLIDYPDDLAQAINVEAENLGAEMKLMAALKLFELGKLSAGKAAELAGMTKRDFIDACAQYRVSMFNYPEGELEGELHADIGTLRTLLS